MGRQFYGKQWDFSNVFAFSALDLHQKAEQWLGIAFRILLTWPWLKRNGRLYIIKNVNIHYVGIIWIFSATKEAKIRRILAWSSKKLVKAHLNKEQSMLMYKCVGGVCRRIMFRAPPGQKAGDCIWKIIKAKGTRGMAKVVECLPASVKPWVQTPVLPKNIIWKIFSGIRRPLPIWLFETQNKILS
jgi:hypothetical protein